MSYAQEAMEDLGLDQPAYHSPEVLALEDAEVGDASGPQSRETLARLEEETKFGVRDKRWKDQDLLATLRLGRPLSLGEFLRILRRASSAFTVADRGAAGMVGLWHRGVYVCGVQPGVMPEFSELRIDEMGLPTKEKKRGWRTVLLNLIQQKLLTEEQAGKLFGVPEGPAAKAYLARLYDLRQVN